MDSQMDSQMGLVRQTHLLKATRLVCAAFTQIQGSGELEEGHLCFTHSARFLRFLLFQAGEMHLKRQAPKSGLQERNEIRGCSQGCAAGTGSADAAAKCLG